jgi:DEAD/DEAH box helicase/Domain of unknown function (DUF1998)/Helicase conserved C-terminal domain
MPNDEQFDHGVHSTALRLTKSLRSYIEAQYHIRNETLIRERRLLLEDAGAVSQRPYVESTPVYELGQAYDDLNIPQAVKDVLSELARKKLGIFERPYVHQATALEAFFERSADLIVATGTGSGKTESFLMPIIGQLAMEASTRPRSASLAGCRALLLYPMNALVNDQLSRIRRLIGSPEGAAIVSRGRDVPVRFASYTGRTPYPGPRSAKRDAERIEPLFEGFYLPVIDDPAKERQLRAIGQLPEKDLRAFFDKSREERGARGQRLRHWNQRLITQPTDRELMTRHETQLRCPELLITNYSMLEFMLMRPIERPIFHQTREWLRADAANELIIVLDEAHMYRGAGGAEVALLLRRLFSRLEVPRERVRFILTSASLGSTEEARRAVDQFGRDLTGMAANSARPFEVVRGTPETRGGARGGTVNEASAMAAFDLAAFERFATDIESARAAVKGLANSLQWSPIGPATDLRDYLFTMLTGFGPLELLIASVSGRASALDTLQETLFGKSEERAAATAALLALATFARRATDQRVLLPTRLHMFFRGLPGLFACCNADCDHSREPHQRAILGRFYTQQRDQCECGARVYELLTHRECGSAFLKGYVDGPHGNFVWDSPSGPLREGQQTPLTEIEILVEGQPHRDQTDECEVAWLDVRSGRLIHGEVPNQTGFRQVFVPAPGMDWGRTGLKFSCCPVCRIETLRSGRSTIMDHSTKGEAPFANLVKTQLDAQPAAREQSRLFPNGGRKVLLFSDGRQKAARLARDIPREVEQDIFRQVLALAVKRLREAGKEPRPVQHLYIAILSVLREFNLPIFDREDARQIEREIERLDKDHPNDTLEELLEDFLPSDSPSRYKIALLKQMCGRYYSLTGTSVGILVPARRPSVKLRNDLPTQVPSLSPTDVEELSLTWIAELADKFALDRDIPDPIRAKATGFYSDRSGSNGRFGKTVREQLPVILGLPTEAIGTIETVLASELCLRNDAGSLFLDPSKIALKINLEEPWYQCRECTALMPATLRRRCISCASEALDVLDPADSEYIRARKGFWREPVRAALGDHPRLRSISVEEHTAQLSNRDNARVHATTEQFELRFRDIQIETRDRPIDVLSCTTTMEVGIDIGSLVAVGLRNVPPQRENYQQRAGRAGRRGSSVSTVLTYAQNGPHDSFYYNDPNQIVAGPPRNPDIKVDNPKIARRHLTSFLFQTFFHGYMDQHNIAIGGPTSALFRALGKANDFFFGDGTLGPDFASFEQWIGTEVIQANGALRQQIRSWLPSNLRTPGTIDQWIGDETAGLIAELRRLRDELRPIAIQDDQPDGEDDERNVLGDEELLEFLFSRGMLPSYAFPTDLTSFTVERLVRAQGGQGQMKTEIVEKPQQGIDKALSEYAPGRLIVINKETYRSGGVTANVLPTVRDRAAPLFAARATLIHCDNCSFVRDLEEGGAAGANCPVCESELQSTEMIVPQVFLPEDGKALDEDDRDQDITYATGAQFPVPVGANDLPEMTSVGEHLSFAVTQDRELVTANKGQLRDEIYNGFWICDCCGRSALEEPPAGSHQRPYKVEFAFGQPAAPRQCNGQFHNVFLGHVFKTDLLLLRLEIASPIVTDTTDSVVLRALEDSLYSIAEALRLSASRHPQLDLDPSEFGAGFRIVPSAESDATFLDVYLYDTLSGGAGYADLAGRYLAEILDDVQALLEDCPARCARSCESCLRHYHNQHLKDRLDRRVAAQLLRYARFGQAPQEESLGKQASDLTALSRLLELDGYVCTAETAVGAGRVPVLVEKDGNSLAIGIKSGLLDETWREHTLERTNSIPTLILNDFILRRNLPDEHQLVRERFGE